MNLFQSTGRTLFYLENWGQLNTDSSVLDIVKGYRLRFKVHPHQFYHPITNPKSSKGFQAIKEEVKSLFSKGAIKKIPKSQAKFVSRLFTVPKKSGGLRPVINLKPLNQFLHLQTFKMEGLSDLKVLLEPNDFMITIDLSDAYTTLPIEEDSRNYLFPISRSNVSILCPSIWSQRCSKNIYKNSETSSRNFKISRFQTSSVPRQHYSSCIYKGTLYLPGSDSDKNFRKPGFCYNSGKIKSGTFTSGPFSRLYCGLKENVLFTSRLKDSINRSECPDSVESTKGFIMKTKPVRWNVQCFKNCSPRSVASLQIDPKSVDKHSKISANHTTELRCENMSEQSVKTRFDLVGKKFENQLFKTNPPSTSGFFNYVRCLRSSLGSSPRICKNSRFLEKLSVFLAHKQKGVKSSLSGIKILNPKSNKCSCSNLHRQQNSGCLYKPFRRHKISGIEFHCSKNVGMVSREEHVSFGSICTRDIEQNCRFVIPPETGINRMDVESQNFQTNSKCIQNASSRPIRIHPKSSSSKVFLLDSG